MRSIQNVLDSHTCTGCGICVNICPKHCIRTFLDIKQGAYTTTLETDLCIDCGLCQKVCPVYTWNNRGHNPYVGAYNNIYSGFSTDDPHRISCASGGMTTAILGYLIEAGVVEAAVVAMRKIESPLESELRVVTTKKEVYASKGSVYAPISYGEIIEKIKESDFSTFAVVGLPCHIEGLSRLCAVDKALGQKIVLKISLVCGHTPSILAYHYSLKRLGVAPDDVRSLSNRGGGWPGFLTITTKNDKEIRVPYGHKYSWGQTLGSPLFTPSGCKHCPDATGYQADLSVCDAWLPRYASDRKGRNLLLVRSSRMQIVLDAMRKEHIVELKEENINDFIEANRSVFKEKLYINSIRNAGVRSGRQLYRKVEYCTIRDHKARCLVYLLLLFEKIGNRMPINACFLFILKVIKYLSFKWIYVEKS